MSVMQAAFAVYQAASIVALGIQLNSSAPAPASCAPAAPAPWNVAVNTMSGNQVRAANTRCLLDGG